MKNTIDIKLPTSPLTTDTFESDVTYNHIVFRSVLSTLVTFYKQGEIVGIIAKSWNNKNNFKEWSFEIRDDLYFDNEELITPEIVKKSFQRMIYLAKINKSRNGFAENLIGFEHFKNQTDKLEGIWVDGKTLNFKFSKSIPNLLSIISNSIYGITNPQNYDANSGKWLDGKKIISSGFYRLVNWDETSASIEKRIFIKGIGHQSSPAKVTFYWDKQDRSYDMVFGISNDVEMKKNDQYRHWGNINSGVSYFRLVSWDNPKSIFYSHSNRIYYRDLFYKQIKNNVKSFFPLGIENVDVCPDLPTSALEKQGENEIKLLNYAGTESNPKIQYYNEQFKKFFENNKINFKIESRSFQEILSDKKTRKTGLDYDLVFAGTSISPQHPREDIKYMFKAQEGIMLPDMNNTINNLIDEKEEFDIQKVNCEIWKQGIVWPVEHYSMHFWSKDYIDNSIINLLIAGVDFNWIGFK